MKTILRLLLATAVTCGALGTVTNASAAPAPHEVPMAPSASASASAAAAYEDAVAAYAEYEHPDVPTWSSSDTDAAIANARGRATPQKTGGTMITATYRETTATPDLAVTVDPSVPVVTLTTSLRNLGAAFVMITYNSTLRLARTALRGVAVVHGNGRLVQCLATTDGWGLAACTARPWR